LDGGPIINHGPYQWIRHPNYAVTIAETFLLPAIFGAWALSAIMGVIWWAVVRYKIVLENESLDARRAGQPVRK
jgi:methyltransferase